MPLSKIHNTLTSDHILLDGTDSTGANANSNVILDSSAANTDVGALMSYEAGADDGSALLTNTHLADMVSPVRAAGRTITIPDVSEPIRTDDDSNIQQFQGTSDTEVIRKYFEIYGIKCVNFFEGMFIFAIWDRREECLYIARDRIGEKPCYYNFQNKKFIFSSEIKSLILAPWIKQVINN